MNTFDLLDKIKTVLGTLKQLGEIGSQVKTVNLETRLVEQQKALNQASEALQEAERKIRDLEAKVIELQSVNEDFSKLQKSGEIYFFGDIAEENAKCPRCVEADRKIRSLSEHSMDKTQLVCSDCGSSFRNPYFQSTFRGTRARTEFNVFDV